MRKVTILLIIIFLKLTANSQDVNFFFYNIPWTLGTDTICQVIKSNPATFQIIDALKNKDQDYYCVSKPYKTNYLKYKPDSVIILGFSVGLCEKTNETWITGETPALTVDIFYNSAKKRKVEFNEILNLFKQKYEYKGENINKDNSTGNYHKFKIESNKDNPQIHLSNYYRDKTGTIRIVLYSIKN